MTGTRTERPNQEPALPPAAPRPLPTTGEKAGCWILLAGIFLAYQGLLPWPALLLTALVVYLKSRARPDPDLPREARHPLFLLFFTAAFAALLLTFPGFDWALPGGGKTWILGGSWMALVLLWAGMAGSFHRLPAAREPKPDLSPRAAALWMAGILALAAFLRLYHAGTVPGSYWDDWGWEAAYPRRAVEWGDYDRAFVFITSPPLYSYVAMLLWKLFPDATSLFMQRLTSTVIDLATVSLLFFIGREAAGRRVGVLAAGLGAVSKPLIVKVLAGMHFVAFPLGASVALLFLLRLLKAPTPARYLLWGAATAFGVYTYSAYWIFPPLLVFGVLAWTLRRGGREGLKSPSTWAALASAPVLLVYFAFMVLNPEGNWIAGILAMTGPFLPSLALAGFLAWSFLVPGAQRSAAKEAASGWAAGAWLCAILCFPVMSHPEILNRAAGIRHSLGDGGTGYLHMLGQHLDLLVKYLTVGAFQADRHDCAFPVDAFLSHPEAVAAALGLAFLAAAPMDRGRRILLAASLLGTLPYLLVPAPYAARLLGCVPPLLVLGAIGLERFTLSMVPARTASLLFLAVGAWAAQGAIDRHHHQWLEGRVVSENATVRHRSLQDRARGIRVYLGPSLENWGQAIVQEGHPVYLWAGVNQIHLAPGEPVPDVAVYMRPIDGELRSRIEREFPQARWEDLRSPAEPDRGVLAWRCSLPARLIADGTGTEGSFQVVRTAGPCWERTFLNGTNGLADGMRLAQDRVADIRAPFPPMVRCEYPAVEYRGRVAVERTGNYRIAGEADQRTLLWVDGQKILDFTFFSTPRFRTPGRAKGSRTVRLEAGVHEVRMKTFRPAPEGVPEFTLRLAGDPREASPLLAAFPTAREEAVVHQDPAAGPEPIALSGTDRLAMRPGE